MIKSSRKSKQRAKTTRTSLRLAGRHKSVYEIIAKTGLTLPEWFKMLDDCGRVRVNSPANVRWLKEKFALPHDYASAIQWNYSTRGKHNI